MKVLAALILSVFVIPVSSFGEELLILHGFVQLEKNYVIFETSKRVYHLKKTVYLENGTSLVKAKRQLASFGKSKNININKIQTQLKFKSGDILKVVDVKNKRYVR